MPRYRVQAQVEIPAQVIEREVMIQADTPKEARKLARTLALGPRHGPVREVLPTGTRIRKLELRPIPQPEVLERICLARGSHAAHLWTPEARCPGRSFGQT